MFAFSANPARFPDAERINCSHRPRSYTATALLSLFVLLAGAVRAEWGGGVSASATDTRSDTARTTVLDQNYDVHFSGISLSRLRYTGTLRYRLLNTDPDNGLAVRQTELQPTADLSWASRIYTIRSSYQYRQFRDDRNISKFTGRLADVYFQTNVPNLPRLLARYEWTQNVNGLELLGQDTHSQLAGVGVRYDIQRLSVSYDFSDNRTDNRTTGLKYSSQQHVGRFSDNLQIIKRAVSLETDYQITARTEEEEHPSSGVTLVELPVVAGLYAADPTPEFGSLGELPSLVDGNTEVPASTDINLSGPEVHNFGLDFGARIDVDHLFLYTDTRTFINAGLRWAVFVSEDSLSWQMVRNYAPGIYSASFNRYEVDFPRQTTRFIKLVDQPQLDNTRIYPTELRGLVSRSDVREPQRATEHRGSATLRVTPQDWLSLSGGADILRTKGSLTSLAQDQDGYRTDVRVNPADWADFSGRAVWSKTSFPQGSSDGLESNQYGFTWQAKWLPTLTTRSTASRVEEGTDGSRVRRSDGLDFRGNMQWLPGLEGMTQISYIENHQLTNGDVVWTRLYAQGFDAQPTPGSYFRIDYRYYDMSARFSYVPDYRESLYLRASYRLTSLIFLSGDLTRDREPTRNDYTETGQVTWTPTFKWTVSAGVTRTDAGEQGGSTLLVSQAMFRWTPRIDLNFSYSHTSYDQATEPEVSSVRLGLNARI